MSRPNVEQRTYLKAQGLNLNDFLLKSQTADNYKFVHKKDNRIIDMRY